jgi:hypothetical protein
MGFSHIEERLGNLWPNLNVIHGRPRYPQSQGMIERANGVIEKKIARWMDTYKQTNWTSILGRVIYTMNCEVSRTTKERPYKLVFGIPPYMDKVLLEELFESGVTEEVLAENVVDIESGDGDENNDENNDDINDENEENEVEGTITAVI